MGINYARLPRLSGVAEYPVTVQMPDSGGLFPSTRSDLPGRTGGPRRVDAADRPGRQRQRKLSKSAPWCTTATAVVASRSAIGEQFLDLRPTSSGAPYLEKGSVISKDKVTLPAPLEDVVNTALDFAESVPVDDLQADRRRGSARRSTVRARI